MKKFLVLIICLQMVAAPVFATKLKDDAFAEEKSENKTPIIKRIVAKINGEEIVLNPSKSGRVPVKISIVEPLTTKQELLEGQEVKFKVLNDVKINNKQTIKKDSIVTATLETVSLNQGFGVPADILIDNFSVRTVDNKTLNLEGNINKIGANRALWVSPIGYVGGIFTLGAGFLLFFIRGGHAKLKTGDVYEMYYTPN